MCLKFYWILLIKNSYYSAISLRGDKNNFLFQNNQFIKVKIIQIKSDLSHELGKLRIDSGINNNPKNLIKEEKQN